MKKKDLILILAILALALALLAYGLSARSGSPAPAVVPEEATGAAVSDYSYLVREAVDAFFDEYPAESYLLVNTGAGTYAPIPLNDDNVFSITQADGRENHIHIGNNSFYMEYSTCDNQNCVEQGEVTLENRDKRLLFNMVICLPNNVSLELLTPEEARDMLLVMYAQAESARAEG